jgi:hypothetical protein
MHTTRLGEDSTTISQDISRMHTSLLPEMPETPTLPRTQRLPVPPQVTHREPQPTTRPELPRVTRSQPHHVTPPAWQQIARTDRLPVPHPERTNFLARQSSAPLALPDLPPLPESGWFSQGPVGSGVFSGPISEAEARERRRVRAQREADAAEAARWRKHADEVSEQIRRDTEQFTTMTVRWRTLVHMARRSEQEDMERARLEVEVPRLSQRLARARKRWTECLVHARECEERAAQ